MKRYTLNESDRKAIAKLLSENRSEPPRPMIPGQKRKAPESADSIWALPPCETGLPAAQFRENGMIAKGVSCCLYRHKNASGQMEPMLDSLGNPIRKVVYNYYPESTNEMVQIWQHKDGHWANERPRTGQQSTTTSDPNANTTKPPQCTGDCIWIANGDGVWAWPIGGCADIPSTTPAPTSTPTPTLTPTSTITTLAPCSDQPCRLRCTQVLPPSPLQPGLFYTLVAGQECPAGCSCYGLGDPCFLLNGEIESQCLGWLSGTTTSTTTVSPIIPGLPCEVAEVVKPLAPDTYRAVSPVGKDEWVECYTCSQGFWNIWPLGGASLVKHNNQQVAIYESPCLPAPCSQDDGEDNDPNKAVYYAFDYDNQLAAWGPYGAEAKGIVGVSEDGANFLANWQLCRTCPSGKRPAFAPPAYIGPTTPGQVTRTETGYKYVVECVDGIGCDKCPNAPIIHDYLPAPTVNEGAPITTTGRPCGCPRPDYCPLPFDCARTACSVGGEIVNGQPPTTIPPTTVPGGSFNLESGGPLNTESGDPFSTETGALPTTPLPRACFLDSTTTTTEPTTTPPPGSCVDSYGTLCNCTSTTTSTTPAPTTTSIPINGLCPPNSILRCDPYGCNCICEPLPPGSTLPPCDHLGCLGVKYYQCWRADSTGPRIANWVEVVRDVGAFEWTPGIGQACLDTWREDECLIPIWGREGFGCNAPPPPISECTVCGEVRTVPCQLQGQVTTRAPRPCDCCASTTPNCNNQCIYKGNAINGWDKIYDECPESCPCQDPATFDFESKDTCDRLRIGCGTTIPPTTIPPSTTLPPKLCCLSDGACITIFGSDVCSNYPGAISAPSQTDCNSCLGACCELSNPPSGYSCFLSNLEGCTGEGFTWYGAGSTCATVGGCVPTTTATTTTPPSTTLPPLGQCCVPNFSEPSGFSCFIQVSEEACTSSFFGTWTNGGNCTGGCGTTTTTTTTTSTTTTTTTTSTTTTTTTTLAPPVGACCFGSTCAGGYTNADCVSAGGTFQGFNTVCSPNPCPTTTTTTTTSTTSTTPSPTLGACCIGINCFDGYTEASCTASGGVYQGPGSNCTFPLPLTCGDA